MENILIDNSDYAEEFLHMLEHEGYKYYIDGENVICDKCCFSFSPEFLHIKNTLPKSAENKYLNKLIFGKNPTEGIVNIEVEDDKLLLFKNDGSVEELPNKYWIVASSKLDREFKRLNGSSHYCYIRYFDTKREWSKVRFSYKNKDIFSIYDSKEAAMALSGVTLFKGMKPSDLSALSFDIETNGLTRNENSRVFIIANTFRDKNGKITKKLFSVDDYVNDSAQMIKSWSIWVRKINPEIMVGHNVFSFDLPYISHVLERDLDEKLLLGVDNSEIRYQKNPSEFRIDGSQSWEYHKAEIYGRQIIDTMFLSVKYDAASKKYDSYGLKSIIKTEGLEKEGRVFVDAAKIKDNWDNLTERKRIKEYALDDSDDALKLFDLQIPSYFYLTQSVPKNLQQIICGNVGAWINSMLIRSYLQDGFGLPKEEDSRDYGGGISYGIPGIYDNVFKVDIRSEYPSVIREYKVYNKKKDPHCNFYNIVEYFTLERFKNKDIAENTGSKYHEDLQASGKLSVNGAYGSLTTPGLLFNSFKDGEFVTRIGRKCIRQSMVWASGKDVKHWFPEYDDGKDNFDDLFVIKDKIIHDFLVPSGDTDSVCIVKKDQSYFSKEERKCLVDELNSIMPKKIQFSNDGFYKKMVTLKAKNYVLFSEDGKVKIKGSALKATTKEKALQLMIKDFINALLDDKDSDIPAIYNRYCKEVISPTLDIARWTSKKTITKKVLHPERTNEAKVLAACASLELQEGDKIRVYFDKTDALKLEQNYNNDHNVDNLLEKIYKTIKIFDSVVSMKNIFNYKLKKNKKLLEAL